MPLSSSVVLLALETKLGNAAHDVGCALSDAGDVSGGEVLTLRTASLLLLFIFVVNSMISGSFVPK